MYALLQKGGKLYMGKKPAVKKFKMKNVSKTFSILPQHPPR